MFKKYGLIIILAIIFVTAAFFIYLKINPKQLPSNLISATGRIDGDITSLNTKYPGRIQKVYIEDAQEIKKGQILAKLQSDEYVAKLNALSQTIDAAKDGLNAVKYQLEIAQATIPLKIKEAKEHISITKAQEQELNDGIASLKDLVTQDARDYNRTKVLYDKKLIGKQKLELSQLKLTSDTNKLSQLRQKKVQAHKAIVIAKDTFKVAQIQKKQLLALQANVQATKKKIAALQANKQELQIMIHQLSLYSPVDGFVIEKIAQEGEVLGSGMIVATLIDPKSLYLKVFIDTLQNGKIKLGDKAVIFLDSNPDEAIEASVVRIAQKAEFTPKEVSVRSDRIQRVFAVYLKPKQIHKELKLGIPAVGVISTDGKDLPHSLDQIPEI